MKYEVKIIRFNQKEEKYEELTEYVENATNYTMIDEFVTFYLFADLPGNLEDFTNMTSFRKNDIVSIKIIN